MSGETTDKRKWYNFFKKKWSDTIKAIIFIIVIILTLLFSGVFGIKIIDFIFVILIIILVFLFIDTVKKEYSDILKSKLIVYILIFIALIFSFNNTVLTSEKMEFDQLLYVKSIFCSFTLYGATNIILFLIIIWQKDSEKKDFLIFKAIKFKKQAPNILLLKEKDEKIINKGRFCFLLLPSLLIFIELVLPLILQKHMNGNANFWFWGFQILIFIAIIIEMRIILFGHQIKQTSENDNLPPDKLNNKKKIPVGDHLKDNDRIFSLGIIDKIDVKREGKHIDSLLYLFFNQFFIIIALLYTELRIGYLITGNKIDVLYDSSSKLFSSIFGLWKTNKETLTFKNLKTCSFALILVFAFLTIIYFLYRFGKYLNGTFLIPLKDSGQVYPLFRYLMKYLYFHNILFSIHTAFWIAFLEKGENHWKVFGGYLLLLVAISCGIYPYIFISFMNLHEELYGYSKMFDFWFISKKNAKVIATSFTLIFLSMLYKQELVTHNLTAWFVSLVTNFVILLIISYVSMIDLWNYREELLNSILAQKVANNIQVATEHVVIIGYEAVGRLYLEEILSRHDIIKSLKIKNFEERKVFLSGHKFSHVYLTNKIVIVAKEGGNIKYLDQIAGVKVGYVKTLSKLFGEKPIDGTTHEFHEVIIPVLIVNEEEVPYYQRICNLDKAALVVQTLGNAQISQAVLLSYLDFKSQETNTPPKFILRVSRSKEKRFLVDLLTNKEAIYQDIISKEENFFTTKDPNVIIFLGKELAGANTSAMIIHFYNLLNHKLKDLKEEIKSITEEKKCFHFPEKTYVLTPFIGTDTTIGNYIASFLATYGLYGPSHQTSEKGSPIQMHPLFLTDSKITRDLISNNLLSPIKESVDYNIEYPKEISSIYNPFVHYVLRDQRFLYPDFKTKGFYIISNIETSHIYFQMLVSLHNNPWFKKSNGENPSNCGAKWVLLIKQKSDCGRPIYKPVVLLFPLTVFLPGDTQLKTIKVLRNFLPIFKDINLGVISEKKGSRQFYTHDHKTTSFEVSEETGYNPEVFVLNLTRGLIDHKFTVSFYGNYLLKSIRKLIQSYQKNHAPNNISLRYGLMSKILSFQEFKRSLATIEVKQMAAISRLLLKNYFEENSKHSKNKRTFYWSQEDICNTVPNNMAEIVKESYLIISKNLGVDKETENNGNNTTSPDVKNKQLRLLFLNAFHCGRKDFCDINKNHNSADYKSELNNTFLEFVVQEIPTNNSPSDDDNKIYPHHCDLALECDASQFNKSVRDGIPTTDFFKITEKTFHFIVCFDGKMPGSLLKVLDKISTVFFDIDPLELDENMIRYNYGCFYTRKCRFSRSNYLTTLWFREKKEESKDPKITVENGKEIREVPQNNGEKDSQNIENTEIEGKINAIIITSFDIDALTELFDKKVKNNNAEFIRKLKGYGQFIPSTKLDKEEIKSGFEKNLVNFIAYFKKEPLSHSKENKLLKCLINNCFASSHLPIIISKNNNTNSNEPKTTRYSNEIDIVLQHILNSLENPITCPIATLKAISLLNPEQINEKTMEQRKNENDLG